MEDSKSPEVETSEVREEAMLYCPRCNAHLIPRNCKLLCQRCGYYMSCADYY